MNPHQTAYYVIIVHYGSAAATDRALNSLVNCKPSPDRVVVIDHADQSYQFSHPAIHIIRPTSNAGYAAGVNQGLGFLATQQTKATDIIICMNNDVTVEPNILRQLSTWWHRHPEPAFLSVKVKENNSTVHGYGHINLLTGRANLQTHPSRRASRRFYQLPATSYQLKYLHGAFLAAPFSAFLTTNGIPDHHFLYWEDPLLSIRAQQEKIPLRVAEHITVHHQQAKSPSVQEDQLYYLVRNGANFLEQETSWPWRRYWWAANRLRLLYHTVYPRHRVVQHALKDAARNVTGPRQTNSV